MSSFILRARATLRLTCGGDDNDVAESHARAIVIPHCRARTHPTRINTVVNTTSERASELRPDYESDRVDDGGDDDDIGNVIDDVQSREPRRSRNFASCCARPPAEKARTRARPPPCPRNAPSNRGAHFRTHRVLFPPPAEQRYR